ncbi:MAG: PIN domain nuclease [Treponemataceae bacterium]|nr:MAG: PIN domain nuclease [Treponemataceae bacterium]
MKSMTALIDTNVIIDYLTQRDPFAQAAEKILQKCFIGEITGYVAAHSITNIFYILRKQYSAAGRKAMLCELCAYIEVAGIGRHKILSALTNEYFDDIEDCLQAECAAFVGADYIVTRNVADFSTSLIPAITPEAFLAQLPSPS